MDDSADIKNPLNFAKLSLIVTDYIPQAFKAQFQLFLETHAKFNVLLCQLLNVLAVFFKLPL